MQLTPQQEAILRQRPHQANLFLSIYRPKTLMAAQVASGTYALGEMTIPYINVSTGTYLNTYPDITVLVGSTPGASDQGRIRMRSATGTYVLMAENAISWQQFQYLTFIDQIDIEAIYPRIIQDPNNQTNVIFYKDWDIPYTNQNSIYGTFPNAGPHRAGFINSGTAYFSATGSYNVLDEALTYSWNFEGGTPTGSTSLTPGDVRWNAPGHYKVRLRTTSASGAVDDTYRYISWYNRPSEGTNTPVLRWELRNLSGSRSEGGYTASFKVYEDLGNVQPNAIVVIFSDNFYGSNQINLGGNAPNSSSIVFVGYIIGDSIQFNYQESSVEFSVGSVSEIMKNTEGFSVSCESKASPATWFELYEMNGPRAVYHYLRWHSTILKVTDFQYIGDNRLVQYFDADRGSLYDSVDSFIRNGMLGELVSDRQGKLWAEISPFGYENPFVSIPNPLPALQKQDWIGDPNITERRNSDMSFIEFGGIIYYGVASNAFTPVLSNAPSTAPLYHGKSERKQGLILSSQLQLNQLSGNYLAHHNSPYPDVSFSLNGIYTNLDIAPQERMKLVISQSDSVRNVSLEQYSYIIQSMEWNYSPTNQTFIPSITVKQMVTGTAGISVAIPIAPPNMGYDYPSLLLPPLPVFNASGPQQIPNGTVTIILHDVTSGPHTSLGLLYTLNFDSSNPTWLQANAGLTLAQYNVINRICVTPNGAVYVAAIGTWTRGNRATPRFIAYAPKLGAPFTIIENQDTVEAKFPAGAGGLCIQALACRPDLPETVIYYAGVGIDGFSDTNNINVYLGSAGGGFAATVNISTIRAGIATASSFSFGQNTWGLTALKVNGFSEDTYFYRLNASATSVLDVVQVDNGSTLRSDHVRAGVSGVIFKIGTTNTKMSRSLDNGATWEVVPSTNDLSAGGTGLDCDDYGQFVMARYQAAGKGRSSDYGTSWQALPTLPTESNRFFGYMGGDNISSQWVVIGPTTVRYSPDFGNTWLNKEGNLIPLVPSLNMVYVVR